jgi:hypothetical protein
MTPDIISRHIVKPRCYECRTGKVMPQEKKKEAIAIDSAIDMLLKMRT